MAAIHKSLRISILLLACLVGRAVTAQTSWPQEIKGSSNGIITIYEPQPEELKGSNLYARAAVSIRKKTGDEPVFGVMWIDAKVTSDAGRKLSTLTQIVVRKAKFAESENIQTDSFKKTVEQGFPGLRVQLSTDGILAAINQEESGQDLKNDPPVVLYRDKPTTLIVLDGEPLEENDEDLKMVRVVNTPYLIVKNPSDKKYYLYGGSFWYSSTRIKDGWVNVKKLPAKIKSIDAKMKAEEKKAATDNEEVTKFTTPTNILVVTEPAELIQTEGKPTYQAVRGSTLLYVNNSLDEIFKDVDTQLNYVLLSGRWFSSASFNGPWRYVPQDALPAAFASIPAGSEKDGVLVSVGGTEEAEEAIMDAYIPQTAKVDRNTARVDVNYDGNPYFVPIENTNLAVAENSNITVMRAANNRYYALENGIWFISNDPYGPWQVANERPSDVDRIPPSSSAYNARYVHIYETTPQYVYVGYTQGYMGNYIYGPTVVWGTGWRYNPWRGRYYRPRPATWGFGMHYNPWTGWNMSFGLGFNLGWYHYGYSRPHYGGGWFGPPAYRPPHRPWGWNGGYYGGRNPGYSRPNYANRPRPVVTVNRPAVITRQSNRTINTNLYRDRRAVVVTRDNVRQPVAARPATTRPSNGNATTRPGVTRPSTGRPATGTGRETNSGRDRTTPATGTPTRETRPGGTTTTRPTRESNTGNERQPVTRPDGGGTGQPSTGTPTRETRPGGNATTLPTRESNTGSERQPVTRPDGGGTRQPTTTQPTTTQPTREQGSTGLNTRQPATQQPSTQPTNRQEPTTRQPTRTTQPTQQQQQQQPARTTQPQRSAEPQRTQPANTRTAPTARPTNSQPARQQQSQPTERSNSRGRE